MTFAAEPATMEARQLLPAPLVWSITAICILPFLLSLVGITFESPDVASLQVAAGSSVPFSVDQSHHALAGSFTHTILEWSAFCAAIFTVVLALAHFRVSKDVTTPVIGLALFFAGCMDAFHTLAATRLIEGVAESRNLIPFTWALCRLFNALIITAGIGFFLVRGSTRVAGGIGMIAATAVAFAITAYSLIWFSATSPTLPETQFPDSLITRPYDAVPLVCFALAAIFVIRPFHRRNPSVFSHSLLIAMIPEIATETYMAFGSSRLFDSNFNIAHFLKVVAYTVPLGGLVFDYVRTLQGERAAVGRLEREVSRRRLIEVRLAARADALERSNAELEQFAYVASHDLQEPLRKIRTFGGRLQQQHAEGLGEQGRDYLERMMNSSSRMHDLITDLLAFSRVAIRAESFAPVDLNAVVAGVLTDLEVTIQESGARIEVAPLLTLNGDESQLRQMFQNLLSNSLKFARKDLPSRIRVSCTPFHSGDQERCRLVFEDNGIGFGPAKAERIFTIFERLNRRDDYAGTGIGLAIVRKIVDHHGGSIEASGDTGQGARFEIDLPLQHYDVAREKGDASASA